MMLGEIVRDASSMTNLQCRGATPAEFPGVLALNRQSEHFLSPLDLDKLSRLAKEAAVFQVALSGKKVAGFLLAFAPAAVYDSPNFLWFKARYCDFLYIHTG